MDTNIGNSEIKKNKRSKLSTTLIIFLIITTFFTLSYFLFSAPINNINEGKVVIHISSDDTLNSIADNLKKERIIRYDFPLKLFVSLFNSDKEIDRGDYLLNRNIPVFVVAWHIANSEHNVNPLKITLREGLTNQEMSKIFNRKFKNFNQGLFLKEAKKEQGYLFPDTYFFYQMDTVNEILNKLSNNFNEQISPLARSISLSGKKLSAIIIMASIIEKEASGKKDASMISGILWKRIKLGIPLQVDADKYTYKNKGLPLSPICNPGLSSIKAALFPVASPYLYYLHDKNGMVHFARNFSEHKKNINRYLR